MTGAEREMQSFRLDPAWGLVGVVIGTVLAVTSVPMSGADEMGALRWSGAALSGGLIFCLLPALLRNPASLFRAEHILMLGLVYWVTLDALQGGYTLENITPDAVRTSLAGVGLFAAFIWIGSVSAWFLVPYRPQREPRVPEPGTEFLFWGGIACWVLGSARIFVGCRLDPGCMIDSFTVGRTGIEPWMRGGGTGNWDTILMNLRYFGYLTIPMAIGLHRKTGHVDSRLLLVVGLGLINLALIMGDGNRRSAGTVVGAGALTWILLQPRITFRELFILAGIAGLLLAMMQAMVLWRNMGYDRALARDAEIFSEERPGIIIDKNLYWLSLAVSVVPEKQPHTGWTGIYAILTGPIPRSVLPNKPRGRGIELTGYTGKYFQRGYSWTASAVGDLWLIGGYLAIAVGGMLYGLLANLCSRFLFWQQKFAGRMMFSAGAMALFVGLRVVGEVIVTGFMLLGLWGLLRLRLMVLTGGRAPLYGRNY